MEAAIWRAFSSVPPFLGYGHDWLLTKEKVKALTWRGQIREPWRLFERVMR